MSPPTSYGVHFNECGHHAWLLAEEYGDGSAWCQRCDEFQTYDVHRAFMENEDTSSQEQAS